MERLGQGTGRTRQKSTVRFREITLDEGLQRGHELHIPAETDRQLKRVVARTNLLRQSRCTRHLIGIAIFVCHAAETVLSRNLIRRIYRSFEPIVRCPSIPVIRLGLPRKQDMLQFGYLLIVRPSLFDRFAPTGNRLGIKEDLPVRIEHLHRFVV